MSRGTVPKGAPPPRPLTCPQPSLGPCPPPPRQTPRPFPTGPTHSPFSSWGRCPRMTASSPWVTSSSERLHGASLPSITACPATRHPPCPGQTTPAGGRRPCEAPANRPTPRRDRQKCPEQTNERVADREARAPGLADFRDELLQDSRAWWAQTPQG